MGVDGFDPLEVGRGKARDMGSCPDGVVGRRVESALKVDEDCQSWVGGDVVLKEGYCI